MEMQWPKDYLIVKLNTLNKYYDTLKSTDKHNRPICSSSGRQSLGALAAGNIKEKLDFLDDHQYTGVDCGSWQANEKYYNSYQELANKIYGKNKKPIVAFEYAMTGGDFRYRGIDYSPVFSKSPMTEEAKKLFIEYTTSSKTEIGNFIRSLSNSNTFNFVK